MPLSDMIDGTSGNDVSKLQCQSYNSHGCIIIKCIDLSSCMQFPFNVHWVKADMISNSNL